MATRDINLRAFIVEQDLKIGEKLDLVGKFLARFEDTVAGDRLLKLSSAEEDPEHDIINDAKFENDAIFGVIMRIDLDANAKNVPPELLKEKAFPMSFLQSAAAKSNIYKRHYYFCFNNKYLVTTLAGNFIIKPFESYINWFLNTVSNPYSFSPMCHSNEEVKLSDIKSVIVGTNRMFANKQEVESIPNLSCKVMSIGLDTIKSLFADTISLSDEELEQVVSAKLHLTLQKPRSMSEEDYQRKFGAFMKPIADDENVQYETKKHGRIKSSTILVIKPIKVEITDKGFWAEEQLRQDMIAFLREVAANDQT